ncbi:hypothetical protein RIF29_25228 [Crotalaria pallida]|uniref:IMS import disulfide relay-system CHCH-CHCH-like Cx9C domain-containing protein n=1 Tax=Crotalaria pallida TaxID=3830 RepID=A0AAN9EM01_CROPI
MRNFTPLDEFDAKTPKGLSFPRADVRSFDGVRSFVITLTPVVDMKEKKNTVSPLKRVLANCSSQAKVYGSCVAAKVPNIDRDVCAKEFLALKSCMQNTLKKKS